MDLRGALIGRLGGEPKASKEGWDLLVTAALEGADALEAQLEAGAPGKKRAARKAAPQPATAPSVAPAPAAFLKSITVEGFRGIGEPAKLDLLPGPGLTLVIGRNGSGKSSFAEALELLLTRETFRWARRSAVWRESWRNLHHPQAAITADFVIEGERGPCTVSMKWGEDADLEEGATSAQVHGKPKGTLEALGWADPLATYRPFLSYNELGSMLDEGPSKLYDALSKILGLDEVVDAQDLLQKARTTREKAVKDVRAMREQVLATLKAMPDERARAVAAALEKGDYDAAEKVLADSAAGASEDGVLRVLRDVSTLAAPSPDAIARAAAQLRGAAARVREAAGTVAGRSRDLAEVLDHALRFHERHGDGPCPVCGRAGALTAAWHKEKAQQAKELRDAAREVEAAQSALKAAQSDALRLPVPRADLLDKAAALELRVDKVRDALKDFAAGLAAADPGELAAHLEAAAPPLQAAVEDLRRAATVDLGKKEDAWRPLAVKLTAWLPQAREAVAAADAVPLLKKAETWLKDAAEEIRNERFEPIAQRSIDIWKQLRLQSNVELGRITLEKSGKQRRVDLHVTVDGVDGAALGVMSQGELHCLALSLFIPRATLPESPFRFIVIDDPVQSMDPARVDGLARVLHTAARDRQVIVFTHDDRLPEAVRRLGIPARAIEVMRREHSVVQPRPAKDPVTSNIEDAMALAYTDALPSHAARRVVPGFCRAALEAACADAVRRRRLGKGEPYGTVADLLDKADKLSARVSLALFDDPKKEGEIYARLNKEHREWADAYRWSNEGSHEEQPGPLVDRIRDAEKLARWLQARP